MNRLTGMVEVLCKKCGKKLTVEGKDFSVLDCVDEENSLYESLSYLTCPICGAEMSVIVKVKEENGHLTVISVEPGANTKVLSHELTVK